jgi:hypothetical protein
LPLSHCDDPICQPRQGLFVFLQNVGRWQWTRERLNANHFVADELANLIGGDYPLHVGSALWRRG